jgi:hypothetical protein
VAWVLAQKDAQFIVAEDAQPITCTSAQIYLYEMVAAACGLVDASRRGLIVDRITVDNQGAQRAWVRGHTACDAADAVMEWAIKEGHRPSTVGWIPSECNLRCDAMSRQWESQPPVIPDQVTCRHLHHDIREPRWHGIRG